MTKVPRNVACPVALHPDGMPRRIPVFEHPLAGHQLVKGGMHTGERPEQAAARELYEESGLETRSALLLGSSDQIASGQIWHFSLCRIVPPVRAKWQHLCKDDGGQLFRFHWHDIDAPTPADMHPIFQNALSWIKDSL